MVMGGSGPTRYSPLLGPGELVWYNTETQRYEYGSNAAANRPVKTQYGYAYVDPRTNAITYDNEPHPYRDKERATDRVKKYREEQAKRLKLLRRTLFWKFINASMFLMAAISLAITALLYWEI